MDLRLSDIAEDSSLETLRNDRTILFSEYSEK